VRENALLRKQLEVACRQIARPRLTRADRVMLVLLARLSPTWHSTTSGAQRRDAITLEFLGRPAAPGGHRVGRRTAIPDPGQRRQVRPSVRHRRDGDGDQDSAYAGAGAECQRRLRAVPAQCACRVPRPRARPRSGAPAVHAAELLRVLQHGPPSPRDRAAGAHGPAREAVRRWISRGAPRARRPPPRVPTRGVARMGQVANTGSVNFVHNVPSIPRGAPPRYPRASRGSRANRISACGRSSRSRGLGLTPRPPAGR